MNLSKNSISILEKRYLLKDENGKIIETPEQMIERVCNYVCGANKELKEKTKQLMLDLKFLPNTPTLMNAGVTNQLSACYVIPIEDSLESIVHDALWEQAAIHKFGGGTGINFSNLRPKGDKIKNLGVTSGVLSFIKNFDTMSGSIHQGGKRDGANMTILSIYHPQIMDFITIKTHNHIDYENMNFSVLVDDNFMKAVIEDKEINLSFPVKSDNVRKKVNARYLFDLICESAHKCGCPGILFEDATNKNNILKDYMWLKDFNPCGESPLFCGTVDVSKWGIYNSSIKTKKLAESCNLGSINLPIYVNNGIFNFNKIEKDIETIVEFMDLIIDVNKYPFSYIEEGTKLTRKIGIGITGFHEALVKMNIAYGSPESVECAKKIMSFISTQCQETSIKLTEKKGVYSMAKLVNDNKRNAITNIIAPTGTIGRLMLGYGHALGIEPPFALYMESNIIESKLDEGIYPPLISVLKSQGWKPETVETLINNIKRNGKSIQELKIPDNIKKLFRTASEIPIEGHIAIQSAFQECIDGAVSKTVNMNHDTSIKDISNAFLLAYKSGLKGITIYRDGSKEKQVLNVPKQIIENGTKELNIDIRPIDDLAPRPSILPGMSFTMKTACNTLFINPTMLKNSSKNALEQFINSAGEGGCLAMKSGLGITFSVYQRILEEVEELGYVPPNLARSSLDIVSSHVLLVTCPACTQLIAKNRILKDRGETIEHEINARSCPNAIAQTMKFMLSHDIKTFIDGKPYDSNDYLPDNLKLKIHEIKKKCPDCGIILIKQEGCSSEGCPNCGIGGCS